MRTRADHADSSVGHARAESSQNGCQHSERALRGRDDGCWHRMPRRVESQREGGKGVCFGLACDWIDGRIGEEPCWPCNEQDAGEGDERGEGFAHGEGFAQPEEADQGCEGGNEEG